LVFADKKGDGHYVYRANCLLSPYRYHNARYVEPNFLRVSMELATALLGLQITRPFQTPLLKSCPATGLNRPMGDPVG
jgi:hypothetical protein